MKKERALEILESGTVTVSDLRGMLKRAFYSYSDIVSADRPSQNFEDMSGRQAYELCRDGYRGVDEDRPVSRHDPLALKAMREFGDYWEEDSAVLPNWPSDDTE
jgi:hypothetical protein